MSGAGDTDPGRAGARLGESRGLWRDRSFRLFFLARFVSLTGSAVTMVALPLLMYQRSGSALDTSLLAATEAVPYVAFGLVAGVISDRVRRRPFLVWFDLASAVVVGIVPAAAAAGVLSVPLIFAVALGAGTCFVFYDAALFGAVPALAGKPGLITANPILEGASTAASVIGPSLGGVLAAGIGAASTLSVDAASFAASAALIAAITRPLQADHGRDRRKLGARGLAEEVAQGLSFLVREPVVGILVVISTALSVAGGAVFGLLVVYATKGLGLSPHSALIGVFYTAAGIGGVGGALYASLLGRRLGPTRAALVSLGFTPAGLAAMAFAPDVAVALVVVAAWVAAYSGVTINAITARQVRIPDHLQGRVNTTARIIAWGLGWLIGAGLGGLLAGSLGVRQTYLAFAFGLTLLTALAWLSPLRSVADRST